VEVQKYLSAQEIRCDNIIKLEYHFTDNDNFYLVMEFCAKGDLLRHIKDKGKMNENHARRYFRQLINAVKYMKDHGVLHRDLKPGNLFVTDADVIKVGDYGCSKKLSSKDELRKSQLGTPNYISPEVFKLNEYSYSCDLWSCGCILYIMLVGKTPFESEMSKMTFRRILKEQYVMPKYLSDEAQDLISKILKVDVNERITVEGVLEHPFLTHYEPAVENVEEKLETGHLVALKQKQDDLINYINPEHLKGSGNSSEDEPIKQEKDYDQRQFSPARNNQISLEIKNESVELDKSHGRNQPIKHSNKSSKVQSGKTKKSRTKIRQSIKS
jgi:serine/threonine protein kinase